MNNSSKRLFRRDEFPDNRSQLKRSSKTFNNNLKPKDIYPVEAAKILDRLNSFNSAEQLRSTIENRTREKLLSIGDAQRILHSKAKIGEFQELQQISSIIRIGSKKFDLIVRALSG